MRLAKIEDAEAEVVEGAGASLRGRMGKIKGKGAREV
jgi:hypothetical protein